jgi:hypothetical protein
VSVLAIIMHGVYASSITNFICLILPFSWRQGDRAGNSRKVIKFIILFIVCTTCVIDSFHVLSREMQQEDQGISKESRVRSKILKSLLISHE